MSNLEFANDVKTFTSDKSDFFFLFYGISFFRPRDSKRLVRILSFFVLVLKVSNNFTNNFTKLTQFLPVIGKGPVPFA